MNDFYARDGSRRVRTGYRQKQKEGIVTIPPFGFFKDKNTKKVVVIEEAVETVRMIFSDYIGGNGSRAIAKKLNEQRRKTPAQIQLELLNKHEPYTYDRVLKKYLWSATMVVRIIRDEAYAGTLICHKSDTNKINKTFRVTEPEEQFRHENFQPAIVSREIWEQAQILLANRKTNHARAGKGNDILRYSGLLRCKDCGRTFIGRRIKLKSGNRVEYRCDTYHRFGKEHCSAHTVDEDDLDKFIEKELLSTKRMYQQNWNALEHWITQWTPQATVAVNKIATLKEKILQTENDIEVILMERIRDKANAERYDRMIEKREAEIAAAKKQIEELQNISEVIRSRQSKLKHDISLIDDILKEERMTEAHLRMLVERIYVHEQDSQIELEIQVKAPFRDHLDTYKNGELTESSQSTSFDFDRLGGIIMGTNDDFYEEEEINNASVDLRAAL